MRFAIATLLLACAGACGDDGGATAGPREHGGEAVGGQIVATVDGVGITVAEVQARVDRTGESPREALDRLEERELLAAEARRRGEDDTRTTDVARARAMVQRFLIERVEEIVTTGSITDEQARARYEAQRDRYVQPTVRRSTHLLFEIAEDATAEAVQEAERQAWAVLREAERGDAEAVLEAASQAGDDRRLERLPPFPRDGALEEPYAEALFATPVGELHPRPVRTRYGFHVLLVTEETPGSVTSFEEAEPEIREALVLEGRAALLSRLIQEAAAEQQVEVREPALSRIAQLELDR